MGSWYYDASLEEKDNRSANMKVITKKNKIEFEIIPELNNSKLREQNWVTDQS